MIGRIKAVIAHYEMTDRAFALQCGIKQNTLSNQLNGMREVSLTTVNAILRVFGDVSAEWLLRGEGNMLLSQFCHDDGSSKVETLVETITMLASTIKNKDARIKELEAELANYKKK